MIIGLLNLTRSRAAWALLSLSALALELCALFFQHGLGLHPCVMCIYERGALFGILGAGLLGMLAPKRWYLRLGALSLWGFSAWHGLQLAIAHTDFQLNPSPFNVCQGFVRFTGGLPLDQWLPWLFNPSGDCGEISWLFLDYTMPQWLVVIFAAYLITCGLMLLTELFKRGRYPRG
ncbi:MAG: disulfide bond formation protein DsbB [Aeromonas sp.]